MSTKLGWMIKKLWGSWMLSCMVDMWEGTSSITSRQTFYVHTNPSCLAFFHAKGFEGQIIPFFKEEGPLSSNNLSNTSNCQRKRWLTSSNCLLGWEWETITLWGVRVRTEEGKALTEVARLPCSKTCFIYFNYGCNSQFSTLLLIFLFNEDHTCGIMLPIEFTLGEYFINAI